MTKVSDIERMSEEERRMRGYDLNEDQRIRKNVALLKSEKVLSSQTGLTMGRYRDICVSGMIQDHAVLAVDTLTGTIFMTKDIERQAAFMGAGYEQRQLDAATLDFVFAYPHPKKQPAISIPEGYSVLPLLFIIKWSELSAEAKAVMRNTETALFGPILILLENIKETEGLNEELEKLERHYQEQLSQG